MRVRVIVISSATFLLLVAAILFAKFGRANMTDDAESGVGDLRILETAEITYAANNPRVGFTCKLSDLSQLVGAQLASGRSAGYSFVLQNCTSDKKSEPISRFQVIVWPAEHIGNGPVYCSDQTAVVRQGRIGYSPQHCFETGVVLQ